MKEKKWCVYKHTSPSGKVYIGITSQKPEQRWRNGKGYKNNEHFFKAIQKYGWDNIKHEIIKDGLIKEEACELEKKLIEIYDSTNCDYGYNKSFGGEGTHGVQSCWKGKHLPKETREKIAQSNTGKKMSKTACENMSKAQKAYACSENYVNPMQGKKHKESTKKKISEVHKGKHLSDEHKQKLSESTKGICKSEDTRKRMSDAAKIRFSNPCNNPASRKCAQIDPNNNETINTFDCLRLAADYVGVASTNISKACRTGCKIKGYKWCYINT